MSPKNASLHQSSIDALCWLRPDCRWMFAPASWQRLSRSGARGGYCFKCNPDPKLSFLGGLGRAQTSVVSPPSTCMQPMIVTGGRIGPTCQPQSPLCHGPKDSLQCLSVGFRRLPSSTSPSPARVSSISTLLDAHIICQRQADLDSHLGLWGSWLTEAPEF